MAVRRNPWVKWRIASLVLVHVAIAVHVAHSRMAERTLSALEVSESLEAVHTGLVTAGAVLMAVLVLSTLLFGRWFCGWGCHVLAMQDLAEWMLRKVGIHPRPVRSRFLLLVAPGAALYLFVWPVLARAFEGTPQPGLQWSEQAMVSSDPWRNMPGLFIGMVTFAVCGFVIVYFLGSRSFCRYACPYGAIFGAMDRFAPGRIVATGECTQCGVCSTVCPSGIDVSRNILEHGMVTSPDCFKDLDCVTACPKQALSFSFTKPPWWRKLLAGRTERYDLTLGEELVAAAAFVPSLVVLRGLYDAVPFLLSLGLAGIVAYCAVLSWRLLRKRWVRVWGRALKADGRVTRTGWGFSAAMVLLAAVMAHSGVVRYHEVRGQWAFVQAGDPDQAARAMHHLQAAGRIGLVRPGSIDRRLASLYLLRDEPSAALPHLRRVLDHAPEDADAWVRLASVADRLAAGGDADGAIEVWSEVAAHHPSDAAAQRALGALLGRQGRLDDAAEHLERALALEPDAGTWSNLGVVRLQRGDEAGALDAFRAATGLDPDHLGAASNLAALLLRRGEIDEAQGWFERALAVDPTDRGARAGLDAIARLRE